MIKAAIIDDEERSRNVLLSLVKEYCPQVKVVGSAGNAAEGFELISSTRPDIIFLDIEMPGENGFDLLEKFSDPSFQVIFTTAYDQYAIKAIKFSALEYLLKPINIEELRAALEKYENHRHKAEFAINNSQKIKALSDNLRQNTSRFSKLAIATMEGYDFIETSDIIWMQASEFYTVFHLTGKKTLVSSQTLKRYEELLEDGTFFRSHHTYLINMDHITKYFKGKNPYVIMSDGAEIPIAFRRKDEFIEMLGRK
jgi:two-component system LytT family response regulator